MIVVPNSLGCLSFKRENRCTVLRLALEVVVQWLGLGTFTAMAWVQSPVRKLRACKLHGLSVCICKQCLGWEVGGRFKREARNIYHIYLWLIHVDMLKNK